MLIAKLTLMDATSGGYAVYENFLAILSPISWESDIKAQTI